MSQLEHFFSLQRLRGRFIVGNKHSPRFITFLGDIQLISVTSRSLSIHTKVTTDGIIYFWAVHTKIEIIFCKFSCQ